MRHYNIASSNMAHKKVNISFDKQTNGKILELKFSGRKLTVSQRYFSEGEV